MDKFWTEVMPACVANFAWGKDFTPKMSIEKWQKGIKSKIQAMDDAEFDLFLAGMVMSAAKQQLMGVELTEKVQFFRSLRK
jgi:hypothetical protein